MARTSNFTDRQKAETFVRDRATCCYTGTSLWYLDPDADVAWVDHVLPVSKGGASIGKPQDQDRVDEADERGGALDGGALARGGGREAGEPFARQSRGDRAGTSSALPTRDAYRRPTEAAAEAVGVSTGESGRGGDGVEQRQRRR